MMKEGILNTIAATNSMTAPIKVELFELIELEEPCVQNETVATYEQPIVQAKSQIKCKSPKESHKQKQNMLKERIILSKLQQRFYQNESMRAAEMFCVRNEIIEIKKKILNIETKLRSDG